MLCESARSVGKGTTDSGGVRGPMRCTYFVPGSKAGAPKATARGGEQRRGADGDEAAGACEARGKRDDGSRDGPGPDSMSDL
jgi:hypothetical protein